MRSSLQIVALALSGGKLVGDTAIVYRALLDQYGQEGVPARQRGQRFADACLCHADQMCPVRGGLELSLSKVDRPVLYSTVTMLAYNINLQFYGGQHYMWCTPYFGSDFNSPVFTVPPSSSPHRIYLDLKSEVDGGDLHGTLIKIKRVGVSRGADEMLRRGMITTAERDDIITIAKKATPEHFRPLLCIIPKMDAIPFHQVVPVKYKANPLSQEYVLADVPTTAFDVIRIG